VKRHRQVAGYIRGRRELANGRRVRAEAVPRETWESLFISQGMKNPTLRIQMLDGFNEGRIEFETGKTGSRKGKVALETVLQKLIELDRKS
jgi:NAD(P)H dehydrogenase (quinone)